LQADLYQFIGTLSAGVQENGGPAPLIGSAHLTGNTAAKRESDDAYVVCVGMIGESGIARFPAVKVCQNHSEIPDASVKYGASK